ncbi:MAG: type II secretion system protein [Patescibacteria group bacterium]
MKRNKQGFTLIEILVAVSIIALLTVMGVTNFMVANKKARDGKRQGDLEQIRAALEIYRADERIYPTTGNFVSEIEPTYMGDIPDDPVTGRDYKYLSTTGASYILCASLELSSAGVPAGCSGCGTACNYKISNPL